MGCCGKRRRVLAQMTEYVRLIYNGPGDLAVTGGITGNHYVFTQGTDQRVDRRDLSNVAKIPGMRIIEQ